MAKKKKQFWKSEKIMSIAAVFISLLTLAVFLYQTNLIRKQQYMTVFPYLELGHSGISNKNYEFAVENKGIGPALISKIEIIYKGKKIDKDLSNFIKSRKTEKDSFSYYYSSIYPGRLISPNENVVLIGNSDQEETSSNRLYEIINDADLELIIEYESIYEEQWRIEKGATGTLKLN